MAAIVLRLALCCALVLAASTLQADDTADLRARLADVANALTAGNPSQAMAAFSKTFKDYEKLRRDFTGLTDSFTITNEVDVLAEPGEDTASPAMTVRWAITLTNPQTQYSNHRAREMRIRFVRERDKWQIAEFAPLDLFDPAQAQQR